MKVGRARSRCQQRTIRVYRALVLPETGARSRIECQIVLVAGFDLEKSRDFLLRLPVLLPINQHSDVVRPRRSVVRRHSQHFPQQLLRVIEQVALVCDSAEQPQRLDVTA